MDQLFILSLAVLRAYDVLCECSSYRRTGDFFLVYNSECTIQCFNFMKDMCLLTGTPDNYRWN